MSGEKEVAKGVTVKASDKTTDENREVTSEVKGKAKSTDKKKEAFAAGGVKLIFPRDPAVADSWKAFIKVGGKLTLFDKKLELGGSAKGEIGPKKTPKLSLDGSVMYIPNKRFSAGVLTNMVIKSEGISGKVTPELTFNILENLSIKAGVPISVDKKGMVEVKGMAGIALTF